MDRIRKFSVVALLVVLGSCAMLGKTQNDTIILVEPGDVVEIVDDQKVMVQASYKDGAGTIIPGFQCRSIAGLVAMPKSIYRKMRAGYVDAYDFLNGKIDEKTFRERMKEAASGPQTDATTAK